VLRGSEQRASVPAFRVTIQRMSTDWIHSGLRAVVLLALVTLVAAPVSDQAQNPIPETFTNLQVLPKDITRQQLVPIMRSFALNLGVRCEHCHLGEGNDLSQFDFASDMRPAKATARKMLGLTRSINDTLAQALGAPAPGSGDRVTCYTCHRGAAKPLTAPPGGRAAAVAPARSVDEERVSRLEARSSALALATAGRRSFSRDDRNGPRVLTTRRAIVAPHTASAQPWAPGRGRMRGCCDAAPRSSWLRSRREPCTSFPNTGCVRPCPARLLDLMLSPS
jgi:hypothetical protein